MIPVDSFGEPYYEICVLGLMAALDCRVKGLQFALMALISYRGHTLIAQSILPISSSTLLCVWHLLLGLLAPD